jgi:hypothetical protein
MKTNDQVIIRALSTDMKTSLQLRATSFCCASLWDFDSATRHAPAFFWREYCAIEQFVLEHFNNDEQRFDPSI